jgi:hypothetical protein
VPGGFEGRARCASRLQEGVQLRHHLGNLGLDPGQYVVDDGQIAWLPTGGDEVELGHLRAATEGGMGDELQDIPCLRPQGQLGEDLLP